jgi:hypothetical protein
MTPTTETIDHGTLSRLVEAGVIRAAHVIGQLETGRWRSEADAGAILEFIAQDSITAACAVCLNSTPYGRCLPR